MKRLIALILIIPVITIACPPLVVFADLDGSLFAVSGTTDGILVEDNALNEEGKTDGGSGGEATAKAMGEPNEYGEVIGSGGEDEVVDAAGAGVGLVEPAVVPAAQGDLSDEKVALDAVGESTTLSNVMTNDVDGDTATSSLEVLDAVESEVVLAEALGLPVSNTGAEITVVATTTTGVVDGTGSGFKAESATSTIDEISQTSTISVVMPAQVKTEIAAQWIIDDTGNISGKLVPSGKIGVSSGFKLCGLAKNADGGDANGIYGQLFYPKNAGFGPDDSRGRLGCGQMTGPVCKMQKADQATENLFCEAAGSGSIIWADGSYEAGVCTEGGIDPEYAVYCCDRELAFDDVAGTYQTLVIARNGADAYSNALPGFFEYEELAAFEVDFGHVYYGKVDENSKTEAVSYDGQISSDKALPLVRNAGNTRISFDVWQDDMGLGMVDGNYSISYGVRLGVEGAWLNYAPFAWSQVPGVVDIGKSAEISFSTFVLRYPEGDIKRDFTGEMNFEARIVPNYACERSALGEPLPVLNEDLGETEPEPADTREIIDVNASTTREVI